MSDSSKSVTGVVWYFPRVQVPTSPSTFQAVTRCGAIGIRLLRVPTEYLETAPKAESMNGSTFRDTPDTVRHSRVYMREKDDPRQVTGVRLASDTITTEDPDHE